MQAITKGPSYRNLQLLRGSAPFWCELLTNRSSKITQQLRVERVFTSSAERGSVKIGVIGNGLNGEDAEVGVCEGVNEVLEGPLDSVVAALALVYCHHHLLLLLLP